MTDIRITAIFLWRLGHPAVAAVAQADEYPIECIGMGGHPMKLATLQFLIAAGESQMLEFKTSFDKAAVESPVAFADAQGTTTCGHLFNELVLYRQHTGNIIDFQKNMLSALEAFT